MFPAASKSFTRSFLSPTKTFAVQRSTPLASQPPQALDFSNAGEIWQILIYTDVCSSVLLYTVNFSETRRTRWHFRLYRTVFQQKSSGTTVSTSLRILFTSGR